MTSILWISFAALPASAFPSFRHHVPNGGRVPCPEGFDGCRVGDAQNFEQPPSVCSGLGHASCAGGDLPLNVFGQALQAAKHEWTKELCEADSDGDGLTNGEELGDPCCLWAAYDTPSDYTKNFVPSHPGFGSSVLRDYTRPSCSSTEPVLKNIRLGEFNSGEEQLQADLTNVDYEIPAVKTTYVDFGWNFDDDSHDVFHIVRAEAIIHQKAHLHHYVIRACSEKFPEELNGKVISRDSRNPSCKERFGGWAPGKRIINMPPWAGKAIGRGVGIVAFQVQVHYDNQLQRSGAIARDGMRMHYTPTLRKQSIGALNVMQLSLNRNVQIPPCKNRFFITRRCELEVRDPTGEGANLLSLSYHAHLLGREMWTEITRDGKTMNLGSDPIWHFDDQYDRNMLDMNFSFRDGDTIQSTCVMNSMDRKLPTNISLETTDEMCWASYRIYPETSKVRCKRGGYIWTGELQDNESAFWLALSHPAADSPTLLSGSASGNGGSTIHSKRYSELPQACEEKPNAVRTPTPAPAPTSTSAASAYGISALLGMSVASACLLSFLQLS